MRDIVSIKRLQNIDKAEGFQWLKQVVNAMINCDTRYHEVNPKGKETSDSSEASQGCP